MATNDDPASSLRRLPGYRWAGKLPAPLKRLILACYWPVKAFVEDFQEYSAEIVGHVPIHALRTGWYRHVCRMQVGENSHIHRQCRMYHPFKIVIGSHSVINYGVLLDGRRGLHIGNNVSISEGTAVLTLEHDVDDAGFGLRGGQVTIEDRVFIGSYARILPGVTIGEGAVIGVGSVVTSDVAPYTVVVGVPARYVRDRSRDLIYQLGYHKRFG
jgi:acetyltransferase-like isoleucine patch superfamily enzyme